VYLDAELIPDGSYGIRIYIKDRVEGYTGDYDTVCVLYHLSQYECEVGLTKGELTEEMNIRIGLYAIEIGYKWLHFHRSEGGVATRWAKKVKTVHGFDYYTVDLVAAQGVYEGIQ
jgi:hypothetical protein